MTGRWLDMTVGPNTGSTGGMNRTVFYLWTTEAPTLCGFRDKKDRTYYCIRALGHPKRHRYGKVVEGTFRARWLP